MWANIVDFLSENMWYVIGGILVVSVAIYLIVKK